MSAVLILTTVPDVRSARRIAGLLVKQKLAACVNLHKNLESVYRWKGKIETSGEVLLIIKTERGFFKKVETLIKTKHPYELPEIISLSAGRGSKEYLSWLKHSLN